MNGGRSFCSLDSAIDRTHGVPAPIPGLNPPGYNSGYTRRMKTAISIPNELFEKAEELAERLEVSRSQLYARAIAEYTERHASKSVREKLDEVYGEQNSELDPALSIMQSISLPPEEW